MKDHAYFGILFRLGQFLHRFRTPLLFWLYMIAMMAYAYAWMPE